MKYLADANLISEPTKRQPFMPACQWLEDNEAEIVTDAVVLGEIWEGIATLPDGRKKTDLTAWFTRLRATLICLPWTDETAVVWGGLKQNIRQSGFTVPIKDTMIAASAKLHHLAVATRNVSDFTRCGVAVVNPFETGA